MTDATEVRTFKIKEHYLDLVQEMIGELNRKAAKLRCEPAAITVTGREERIQKTSLGHKYTQVYLLVTVTGVTPKLDGWRLVATVERMEGGENIVACVPGQECPAEYRNADTSCDHCKSERKRKEVFVLGHDDGRFVQVGRNCISDFLGGKSPADLLAYVEYIQSVCSEMSGAEDEGDGWGMRCKGRDGFNTDEFLHTVAVVIRKMGWVSAKVARENDGMVPTIRNVMYLLTPPRNNDQRRDLEEFIAKYNLVPEDRDAELAAAALAWGKALPTDAGDYIYNLGVACRMPFVVDKTAGILASLIAAYQREQDRANELRIERETKTRGHVGTVGERSEFLALTVVALRSFDSDYGVRTLCRFEDATGNILIWWASGEPEWLKEGETVSIKGTVKKHDDYKGTPQTLLSRVAEFKPKPPKEKKVRKSKAA